MLCSIIDGVDLMAEEKKKEINVKFKFKPIYAAAVVAILAVIGVIYLATNSSAAPTVVAIGDNVSVYYTGTFQNGTVFDSNVGKQPLTFIAGSGQLIPGFDQGVIGMALNQSKTITVPPKEGYGLVNQSLIVVVPRSVFGNQSITVGMMVKSTGNGQQGLVTAVNATNVTIDFNPPLAGKTLIFQVKVVAINKKL